MWQRLWAPVVLCTHVLSCYQRVKLVTTVKVLPGGPTSRCSSSQPTNWLSLGPLGSRCVARPCRQQGVTQKWLRCRPSARTPSPGCTPLGRVPPPGACGPVGEAGSSPRGARSWVGRPGAASRATRAAGVSGKHLCWTHLSCSLPSRSAWSASRSSPLQYSPKAAEPQRCRWPEGGGSRDAVWTRAGWARLPAW